MAQKKGGSETTLCSNGSFMNSHPLWKMDLAWTRSTDIINATDNNTVFFKDVYSAISMLVVFMWGQEGWSSWRRRFEVFVDVFGVKGGDSNCINVSGKIIMDRDFDDGEKEEEKSKDDETSEGQL